MLDNEGRTWMILRTQMTISKYASWCDEYDIETWCQEGYRLYCPRYVEARDKKTGELLFNSKNLWVIMDMVKNRPERPSYIDGRLAYVDPNVRHFDPALPKFPQEEEYTDVSGFGTPAPRDKRYGVLKFGDDYDIRQDPDSPVDIFKRK